MQQPLLVFSERVRRASGTCDYMVCPWILFFLSFLRGFFNNQASSASLIIISNVVLAFNMIS